MGGKSSSETQTSQTTSPWAPAQPALTSLLGSLGSRAGNVGLTGTESGALNTMSANAANGNPYASQIGGVANTLLNGGGPDRGGMVSDAYSQFQGQMTPFARGDYVDPSQNPGLQAYLSTIGNDVAKRVGSMYAGAGRDPSGAGSMPQTMGRGIAEGTAPVLYDAYNQARSQQLGAINSLYGAGGTTAGLLSGLDQTRLGNQTAGVGMSNEALQAGNYGPMMQLAIEAQRRGIPMQELGQLTSLVGGIASLGGQSQGTSNTTQQLSPMQTFLGWTQGLKNLFGPVSSLSGMGG